MKRPTVQLLGYFDRNFGDDYMLKLIAEGLPEIDFVIDKSETVPPFLANTKNITLQDITRDTKYPRLLVIGSGFMINSKAALISEIKSLIKGRSVADYCLGCNIEPLNSATAKWLICRKLNKLRLIVCRDKNSFSFLKKNVKKPHIKYLPDILFSLPDDVLPRRSGGKKLGISLMHRKGDTDTCEYYRSMAKAVDFWIDSTGENAVLMAFDSGEENDLYSCECVKKLTVHPDKVEIAVHKNGNEIFEAYSDCNRIISTRFHSAVLALRMGLPFYPVVYRDKMKNLLEDMAYPIGGSSIDDVDICDVKEFLLSEPHYKLSENVISDSTLYARVFKETFNKDSEMQ